MNLGWIEVLADLSAGATLLLKLTVLLALGWAIHLALRRSNPRWRVLLWRGLALGLFLLPPLGLLGPRFQVPILPAAEMQFPSVSNRMMGFGGMAIAASSPAAGFSGTGAAEETRPGIARRVTAWKSRVVAWFNAHSSLPLAAVWGGVALALAARALRIHGRSRRTLDSARPAPEPARRLLRTIAAKLRCREDIRLYCSPDVVTPFLTGIRKPVIVLPEPLTAPEGARDLPAILVHEVSHAQSQDLLWARIIQGLTIVFWFHPLVWGIRRTYGAVCEEVCDAVAADYVGDTSAYSATLARVALALVGRRHAFGGIPMARKAQIRVRLELLKQRICALPLPRRWLAFSFLAGGLLLLGISGMRLAYAWESVFLPRVQNIALAAGENPEATERVVHFPANRPMGDLGIQDIATTAAAADSPGGGEGAGWQRLGLALGDVAVPAGKRVHLTISHPAALRDLSPLARLGPNDLYRLTLRCDTVPGLGADSRILPYLRGLTGLKVLELDYVNLTQKGVQLLTGLRSLTHLTIRTEAILKGATPTSRQLDDACLASLTELKSLESLYLAGHDITDAGLPQLAKLPALRELHLWTVKVRGAGLPAFARHPALRSLNFYGRGFGDANLKYLSSLTSLKKLCLTGLPITDKGLAQLSNLTGLEELNLHNTRITDAGLVHLAPLRSLKRLDISRRGDETTRIKDDGLVHLKELQSLEYLNLLNIDVSDRGLAWLAELPNLKCLYLPSVGEVGPNKDTYYCTDKGVKELARLHALEDLLVGSPAITDASMACLGELTRLKTLRINARLATNEGLTKLGNLKSLHTLQLDTPKVTLSGLNRLNALANLTRLRANSITQDNLGLDLSQLTRLEELTITLRRARKGDPVQFDRFRDEDLACLAKLTRLRSLQGITGIGNAGLKHLSGLTALTMLSVGGPRITDDGLASLAGMKDLYHLRVDGDITDEGLRHLEGFNGLAYLTITSRSACSKAAVDRLRSTLPNLQYLKIVP